MHGGIEMSEKTWEALERASSRGAVITAATPSGESHVIDPINPSHYKSGGLEVIDVIEAFDLDFARGNAVKYLLRAGRKQGEAELVELRKAAWYIARAIVQLERK
jgi:hypothetical protein